MFQMQNWMNPDIETTGLTNEQGIETWTEICLEIKKSNLHNLTHLLRPLQCSSAPSQQEQDLKSKNQLQIYSPIFQSFNFNIYFAFILSYFPYNFLHYLTLCAIKQNQLSTLSYIMCKLTKITFFLNNFSTFFLNNFPTWFLPSDHPSYKP